MKSTDINIIQSYWSLPSLYQRDEKNAECKNNGGWMSEKIHAMSWALSCLKYIEFYKHVHLYSDEAGIEWLINRLHLLPYTKVFNTLDSMNTYPPTLYALPKMHTYLQQTESFIHSDGDIFIWKAFDKKLIKKPLIVQNFVEYKSDEENKKNILAIVEKVPHIPQSLKDTLLDIQKKSVHSIIAGITGGNHLEILHAFANKVFKLIEKNKDALTNPIYLLNSIVEEFYFYLYAKERGVTIHPLFYHTHRSIVPFLKFNTAPITDIYIHVIASENKRRSIFCEQVSLRLKYEYPQMHKHIESIYSEEKKLYNIEGLSTTEKKEIQKEVFRLTLQMLHSLGIEEYPTDLEAFYKWIEEVYFANKDKSGFKMMSDVFQIEKAFYELRCSESEYELIVKEKEEHILMSFDFLYHKTMEEFLGLPLTLNKKACSILYLSHQFPMPLTQDTLQQIENKMEFPISPSIQMVLVMPYLYNKPNETILLSGWESLLYRFDNETLTGNELIHFVQQNTHKLKYNGKDIKKDVLELLTTYIYYSALLKIVV